MKLNTLFILTGVMLSIALIPGELQAKNILKTGPLPVCGADDAVFKRLRGELGQTIAWKGDRFDKSGLRIGSLELTAARSGHWSLFFRFTAPDGKKAACLVARGENGEPLFGRRI